MKQKFEYIDFAKGYAISTIVLYHCLQKVSLPPVMQQAIGLGGTGVHLFFLISGLGLMLSSFSGTALGFYQRRAIKVWKPYAIALTLSFVVNLFVPLFPSGWRSWLAGIFLYQMFVDEHIEGFGGHFWFISAIMQFYLVFPLLQRGIGVVKSEENTDKRHEGRVWLFVSLSFAASLCWWLLVSCLGKEQSRSWSSFFLQYLWEFGLGMAIGVWIQQGIAEAYFEKIRRYWWLCLPVALLGFGLMAILVTQFGRVGKLFNDMPALAGYAALSYFIYVGSTLFLPFIKRFFLWINGFSYSLYLIHVLVLELYLHGIQQGLGLSVSLPLMLTFLPLAAAAGWGFERVMRVDWVRGG